MILWENHEWAQNNNAGKCFGILLKVNHYTLDAQEEPLARVPGGNRIWIAIGAMTMLLLWTKLKPCFSCGQSINRKQKSPSGRHATFAKVAKIFTGYRPATLRNHLQLHSIETTITTKSDKSCEGFLRPGRVERTIMSFHEVIMVSAVVPMIFVDTIITILLGYKEEVTQSCH